MKRVQQQAHLAAQRLAERVDHAANAAAGASVELAGSSMMNNV
ncbi:MAG TPA: hypothetical protein PKA64_09560 [Myxococcota bacterium]|nr:hypothetical protein [Myxococcota bacterium]